MQTKQNTSCGGEWSAARNIAKKKKSLDCNGLEVASCRHQFGQKAINMKRGEIYAYPMYLLQHFIIPNHVTFIFADVMCKLWPYLCKKDPTIPAKIKAALSVMHAKGHNLNCQVCHFSCFFSFLILKLKSCNKGKFLLFSFFSLRS